MSKHFENALTRSVGRIVLFSAFGFAILYMVTEVVARLINA